MGRYQGASYDAMREAGIMARMITWSQRPPGGESHADLARRVVGALAAHEAAGVSGCVLFVAHGGVIRTLLGLLAPGVYDESFADGAEPILLVTRPEQPPILNNQPDDIDLETAVAMLAEKAAKGGGRRRAKKKPAAKKKAAKKKPAAKKKAAKKKAGGSDG